MNKSGKLLKIIAGIVVIAIVAAGVFVATFDADKYRPRIAEAVSKQLGREVKLEGPISLGLSLSHGVTLVVRDVSVANPTWFSGATRPVMAKVGKLELGVALPPLLRHEIEVTSLTLKDADVRLETNAADQKNWEMKPVEKGAPAKPAPAEEATKPAAEKGGAGAPAFRINKVDVSNTRLTMRAKDGKTTEIKVGSLGFTPDGKGMKLNFKGEVNGNPVELDLKGQKSLEELSTAKWPFDAEARYAPFTLLAKGTLDDKAKNAVIDTYEIKSGNTRITGNMNVAYGGERTVMQGTVNSDKLDPADLKAEPAAGAEAAKPAGKAARGGEGKKRVFSAEPLNLDGLKAADARLDIAISEMPVGPSALKHIKAKLDLTNGRLLLSPVKAEVAGTQAEGQVKLDAEKAPAQFSAILKAYQLDLAQFVRLSGLKSFLESKGDADMDITTSGNSMHDFASNSNGQINLIMAGGNVQQRVLGEVAGALMNIFAPGSGQLAKPELNCFVAHFKITNGQVQTTGLLADTGQATIAGSGGVNLRDETIDMLLHTRPKLAGINSTLDQISSMAPPVRIRGPLTGPTYTPDPSAGAQKIAGLIGGGAFSESGAPEIIKKAGQNDCEYTLTHPQEAKPSVLPEPVAKAAEKARETVKDVGGKVMEGIGGLFGK